MQSAFTVYSSSALARYQPPVLMTEYEWCTCADPAAMLKAVKPQSLRQTRLLCCAMTRQVWNELTAVDKEAVVAAEQYADDHLSAQRLQILWSRCLSLADAPFQPSFSAGRCSESDEYLELSPGVVVDNLKALVPAFTLCNIIRDVVMYEPLALYTVSQRTKRIAEAAYRSYDPATGELDNSTLSVLTDSMIDDGWPEEVRIPCPNNLNPDHPELHICRMCWDTQGYVVAADHAVHHLRYQSSHVRGCYVLEALWRS